LGLNGFVVPQRDPAALAAAMRRFVDDPSFSPRMGKASRRIAEEIFDVKKVNAVMMRAMMLETGISGRSGENSLTKGT
jgi:glycosyltransferase involved in cell wall biosynthesis